MWLAKHGAVLVASSLHTGRGTNGGVGRQELIEGGNRTVQALVSILVVYETQIMRTSAQDPVFGDNLTVGWSYLRNQ